MRNLYRFCAGVVSVTTMCIMAVALHLQIELPDNFNVAPGETLSIISPFNIEVDNSLAISSSANSNNGKYSTNIKLMGVVDIKQVNVQVVDRQMVVPCGTPFGIKMFTDGVMIVDSGSVMSNGKSINPAQQADVQVGDIITHVNGNNVYSNKELSKEIQKSGDGAIDIKLNREGIPLQRTLVPIKCDTDGKYKAGIWVRDSSAGIGTMTFYSPTSASFAGLGHGICDIDTGAIMPLHEGEIVRASITDVNLGRSGVPGELQGMFVQEKPLGSLEINNKTGVYGKLYDTPILADSMPIAYKHEVKTGPAVIMTTTSGERPSTYSINIDSINYSNSNPTKNMVITITDPQLLSETGGIVQGMGLRYNKDNTKRFSLNVVLIVFI